MVENSKLEMKSLKNVLRIPRLCELYRKKFDNIKEEMTMHDYYKTQCSKTTSELV